MFWAATYQKPFRHRNQFHFLATKTWEVPLHWGLSTLLPPWSESVCSCTLSGESKTILGVQASQQEGCARKAMHMPAHPCGCDQEKEEGRGSAAKELGTNSLLLWIPNQISSSPPRSFPSLLEAVYMNYLVALGHVDLLPAQQLNAPAVSRQSGYNTSKHRALKKTDVCFKIQKYQTADWCKPLFMSPNESSRGDLSQRLLARREPRTLTVSPLFLALPASV